MPIFPAEADCIRCENERLATRPFEEFLAQRLIVCQICGNKRCPKATDHRNRCTHSNAPGQAGSIYDKAAPHYDSPTPR